MRTTWPQGRNTRAPQDQQGKPAEKLPAWFSANELHNRKDYTTGSPFLRTTRHAPRDLLLDRPWESTRCQHRILAVASCVEAVHPSISGSLAGQAFGTPGTDRLENGIGSRKGASSCCCRFIELAMATLRNVCGLMVIGKDGNGGGVACGVADNTVLDEISRTAVSDRNPASFRSSYLCRPSRSYCLTLKS